LTSPYLSSSYQKMKSKIFIILGICLLLTCEVTPFQVEKIIRKTNVPAKPNPIDTCRECIEFAIETLDTLLNTLLNEGLIGSCSKLCSNITNPYFNAGCNLLCDAVGLDLFIRALNKSDLDPIYYCQMLDLCAVDDCTAPVCTKIFIHEVRPETGPIGTKFLIETYFGIINTAGAGMLRYQFYQKNPKDSLYFDFLIERYAPKGNYSEIIELDSGEQGLQLGEWTAEIYFCEGECGSKHPHSRILDSAKAIFTVTKKKL